ncbi:MAG TPA: heavy metal-binding domain-containing protein [Flavobacterium sp.]|nr:heavy metal-binding domain-containing protein [Flavobacterium sp.]
MKKIIISAINLAFVAVSCNQKSKQTETTNTPMMENDGTMMEKDSTMMEKDSTMVKGADGKLYACPMHPEVQGKSTDQCSKCGMDLTEEVK